MRRVLLRLAAGLALVAAGPAVAPAAAAPIPEGPDAASLPPFVGEPVAPRPVPAPAPPRHPFMAPNGLGTIHADAYQTDTHLRTGPLGRGTTRRTNARLADCATHTFDRRGRLITVCVGVVRPTLTLFDPVSLDVLAELPLPPRRVGGPGPVNPFQDFSGGGYFFLDERDRAVIPTTDLHVYVVRVEEGPDGPAFVRERDTDLSGVLPDGDRITSVMPDWEGRTWFVSRGGTVGFIARDREVVRTRRLDGEEITDSFAVDETGGVYVVSDRALYRFDAGPDGPRVTWREGYDNTFRIKPGQVNDGSGTTPTLMGDDLVAITDNADPMQIAVFRRGASVRGRRLVCEHPVFTEQGGATDNSLIGTHRSLVVENNLGYTGPATTQNGRSTTPGLERVDVDRRRNRCRTVWRSGETAPTVVPKLSLGSGLVYTYTKDARADGTDAWYLTALDFRTGRTRWKALGGEGLGHNNNYAPITIGPDGSAYVGVLGGILRVADAEPPPQVAPPAPRVRLALRGRRGRGGCRRGRVVAGVRGADAFEADRLAVRLGRRVGRDARAPLRIALPVPRGRRAHVRARVALLDGRVARLRRTVRGCG